MANGVAAHHALAPKAAAVVSEPMVAAMYTPSVQSAGFGHQRHGGGAAATEDEGVDRHAVGSSHWASSAGLLVAATVKRAVGVGGLGAGFPGDLGRPVPPCQSIRCAGGRHRPFHAFPPHVAVVGQRDVGEDHVRSGWRMQLGLVCVLVPGATPK